MYFFQYTLSVMGCSCFDTEKLEGMRGNERADEEKSEAWKFNKI